MHAWRGTWLVLVFSMRHVQCHQIMLHKGETCKQNESLGCYYSGQRGDKKTRKLEMWIVQSQKLLWTIFNNFNLWMIENLLELIQGAC